MTTFRISGQIIDLHTHQGLFAVRVEAWDKDLICSDLVGSAVTDSQGVFQITFDESYFQELFFDRRPDLFFKVYSAGNLIKSTEDSVLWNINAKEIPIVIEVEMMIDTRPNLTPDRQPIKPLQAQRLAALTGLKAEDVVNKNVAELSEQLKWQIDPELFLFRRICGKVVKTDPTTGVDYPVPGATVHILDTDCTFLGLFPIESPWAWLFPVFCHTEEIGTAKTDGCGNFCAWVPRFEIDWILRWRLERHCLGELLIKPKLLDLLKSLKLIPIPRPGPDPDPDPVTFLARNPNAIRRVASLAGKEVAQKLQAIAQSAVSNLRPTESQALLNRPVFDRSVPPPIPDALRQLDSAFQQGGPQVLETHLGSKHQYQLDLKRYIGPFLRPPCWYEIEAEWLPLLDVPDITFRVTQDVDSDGTEETIYSEGFFDVRWNKGAISPVTLHASQIAVAAPLCGNIPEITCTQAGEGAGIKGISLMLAEPPAVGDPPVSGYIDPVTGFARRPNRPHPDGLIKGSAFSTNDPAATAPFLGTLLLRGCNQMPNAAFYRVLYSHNGGPEAPFLNLSWPIFRPLGSPPTWVNPVDGKGWYNILPDPGNWLVPYLLLAWPSYQFQPGTYELRVELANASKNHLVYSKPIRVNVDNSSPLGAITSLNWRVVGSTIWTSLLLQCPVIRRPVGEDIEFQVVWQVSSLHLLYGQLVASGCGSSTAVLSLQPPMPTATSAQTLATTEHWYTSEADNTTSATAVYRLKFPSAGQPDNQGAYSFWVNAYSRAIDPSHATGYNADWNYNQLWIGGTIDFHSVAVVNL